MNQRHLFSPNVFFQLSAYVIYLKILFSIRAPASSYDQLLMIRNVWMQNITTSEMLKAPLAIVRLLYLTPVSGVKKVVAKQVQRPNMV